MLIIFVIFAIIWHNKKFYPLVLPLVDHSFSNQKIYLRQKNRTRSIPPTITSKRLVRIWHVVFFSMSVLLSIRFKKEWIEKNNSLFLLLVSLEWALGNLLYVLFGIGVKNYEFGYIKGFFGL